MALTKCADCGREMSDSALACPGCGKPASAGAGTTPAKPAIGPAFKGFLSLLMFAALGWYFFGGGQEQHVEHEMNKIETQVANDFVQQYEMAKRNGEGMDQCVQAGLVAVGFQQAGDEPSYAKWKKIEADDCAAAGVPK